MKRFKYYKTFEGITRKNKLDSISSIFQELYDSFNVKECVKMYHVTDSDSWFSNIKDLKNKTGNIDVYYRLGGIKFDLSDISISSEFYNILSHISKAHTIELQTDRNGSFNVWYKSDEKI